MLIFGKNTYEKPIKIIQAFDNQEFIEAFSKIMEFKKRQEIAMVGYIRYDAKDIFLKKEIKSDLPLLYFEVFEKGISDIYENKENYTENILNLKINPTLTFEDYKNAISKIKKEIKSGNTYEVNYTYDWELIDCDNKNGFNLFKQLLPRQKTPFNAYIKNEFEEILSFSPELFFELKDNKIFTKPMKGTIQRGKTEQEDLANIEFLKNDIKNRAENVMIVDLLRNDLGRIAKTGSVKVNKLFEIESHNTLHQMTSEISAEVEDSKTLLDIFEAIFPCGSITGAPKISTMKIIEKIETGKRGIYCGAIGLISNEETIFSVPIRILQKKNGENFYQYRTGGAVVWDSTAEDEWEETSVKTDFLMQDFKLIETMLIENNKIFLKEQHLKRLEKSAVEFGYVFSKSKIEQKLQTIIDDCKKNENLILRLTLDKSGAFETELKPLNIIKTNKITISKAPINSKNKMLHHKTTKRPWYFDSMKKINRDEIFDEIYFNEKSELTEGARTNIVLQINGKLYTPPVSSGILNGVFRQKLIDEEKIEEKILKSSDLKSAAKIFCINSVRKMVEVQLDFNR